ncbi:MAG: MFS transporter [Fimbriimonadaceae bacterium]|jgi:MFS family permease|nr:MFS transporter [Fimbriimonadaceae bacterium]
MQNEKEVRSPVGGYRHTMAWNLGFSAYWFATSYKWFILLFIFVPDLVSRVVPGGEKNTWWGIVFGTGAVWAVFGPSLFGRLNETARGFWAKRWPWIMLGTGVTIVALASLAGAQALAWIALAYFMLQVGDDLATGPYAGMVAAVVPENHRGFASAVLGSLRFAGQILSAIVYVIVLVSQLPLNLILLVIGLLNIVCAGLTILTIRNLPPSQRSEARHQTSYLKDWWASFQNRDFRFVYLNKFVVALAFSMVAGYTLNYLKDMHRSYRVWGFDLGQPQTTALALVLVISLMGVLGSAIPAYTSDRWGRKPLLISAGLMAAFCLAPIAFVRDLDLVFLCVVGFGLANGVYAATDWALVSDILPDKEQAGTSMGIWSSAETSVQVFGGAIGILIDTLNRQSMGAGYSTMALTAAMLFLLSTLFVRLIRGSR